MTKLPLSLAVGCSLLLTGPLTACRAAEPEPGQIAVSEAKALEQLHYTRHSLDDSMSDRCCTRTSRRTTSTGCSSPRATSCDFEKKYDHELDDAIWLGDLKPAQVIYDLYLKRVEARVGKIKKLLETEKFDFDGHGTIEISRQKAPWPKDEADADRLWHDRIENEILTEHLAETTPVDKKPAKAPDSEAKTPPAPDSTPKTVAEDKPKETPEQMVAKRYDRLLRSLHEQTKDDVAKFFLNALAQCYDPHSEYMSPSEMENFSINMRLSLIGIGAILRKEDEYSKIVELIAGGPAASQGELKVDDKIAAVAQGNEPFVDVVDMKLDKVVEMIRGKKGTVVRLQVVSAGTSDNSKRKVISITRDEVKLTDQEARAEIIEHKRDDGTVEKLGWITLPGFYADMDGSRATGAKRKSTTKDVAALLTRLNKEGITGLVMDIRRNGGGSLEEAINLTGLFIKKGPVVQSEGLQQADHGAERQGPIDPLQRPDGRADQPHQRVGERDFRRGVAGLSTRGDRGRQEHLRQRHGADAAGTGALHVAVRVQGGRRRGAQADDPEILPALGSIDAAQGRGKRHRAAFALRAPGRGRGFAQVPAGL